MNPVKQISKQRFRAAKLLLGGGLVSILFGALHFWSFYTSGTNIELSDGIINTLFGILNLICFRFLEKGRVLALYGGILSIFISLCYGLAVGRGFNFIVVILGGFFLMPLVQLWRQGELT